MMVRMMIISMTTIIIVICTHVHVAACNDTCSLDKPGKPLIC